VVNPSGFGCVVRDGSSQGNGLFLKMKRFKEYRDAQILALAERHVEEGGQ
jgi:hypothetical protein